MTTAAASALAIAAAPQHKRVTAPTGRTGLLGTARGHRRSASRLDRMDRAQQ